MDPTEEDFRKATNGQLLAMLDRRHPEYDCNLAHWNFLNATYQGGRRWFKGNIFRYFREGLKEFRGRIERAYRFNHTREVVDLVNKYVFKGDIQRSEDAPSVISDFWAATTLFKRPIKEFMGTVSRQSSIYGRVWVVVDNNIPSEALTQQDVKDSKGRIYAYTVDPLSVLDFAYDDDGELEWILMLETQRDSANPLTASGAVKVQYRLWMEDAYALFHIETKDDKSRIAVMDKFQATGLGIVPVFCVDHNSSDELYTSPSMIGDVAYLDRACANYLSNLDAIIQDQTFSQLTMPMQGVLPGENGDDREKILFEMGTKRIMAFDGTAGGTPEYISPDPKQAAIILTVITKIIGEIYHSIGMAGERTKEDNSAGIDNSSGVAKAYDFEKLNAMLVSKAQSLEMCEHNLVRLVNAWSGDVKELQDTEKLASYPSTFDVRNLADELVIAQQLSLLGAPDKLRQEQMDRVVDKLFPQLSADLKKAIRDDIDNNWLKEDPSLLPPAKPSAQASTPAAPKNTGRKGNRQGENNKPAA